MIEIINPTIAKRDQIIFKLNRLFSVSFELFLVSSEIPPIPNNALATIRDINGSMVPQPKSDKKYSGKMNRGIAIK